MTEVLHPFAFGFISGAFAVAMVWIFVHFKQKEGKR